jgi:osmotically-inducible protein OsmY
VIVWRILKRYLPLSGSALALWAWRKRDNVIDWTAFGIRSAQNLVNGNSDDPKAEARLRMALAMNTRVRSAPALEVVVRDGIAVLEGVVDPQVHDVAVKLAGRTQGIKKVDDRLDEVRGRT